MAGKSSAAKQAASTEAQGDGTGTQPEGAAVPETVAQPESGTPGVGADGAMPAAGAALVGDDTSTPDDGTEGTAPAGDGQDVATPAAPGGTPAAAPLTPPAPKVTPRTPAPAATEPNAAVRQPDGGHVGYTDHEGNPLKHDELFEDPGPQFTFMVTAKRILQKFHFPGQHKGSSRTSAQLVYNAGVKVPRHLAHALIDAVKADAEGGAQDS